MTQTATLEVKYVNPPKDGKLYGSIKGANNDSYPVKKDRIHEFIEGHRYKQGAGGGSRPPNLCEDHFIV